MSYTCKWHPRASQRLSHTKEECIAWHAYELNVLLDPLKGSKVLMGTDQHDEHVKRSRDALLELLTQ